MAKAISRTATMSIWRAATVSLSGFAFLSMIDPALPRHAAGRAKPDGVDNHYSANAIGEREEQAVPSRDAKIERPRDMEAQGRQGRGQSKAQRHASARRAAETMRIVGDRR